MARSFSLLHFPLPKQNSLYHFKTRVLDTGNILHMPQIQSFSGIFLKFCKKYDVPGHTGEIPHAIFGRQWS